MIREQAVILGRRIGAAQLFVLGLDRFQPYSVRRQWVDMRLLIPYVEEEEWMVNGSSD